MIIAQDASFCPVIVVVFFYASLSMQLETARTVEVELGGRWGRRIEKFVSDAIRIMNQWLGLAVGEMFVCLKFDYCEVTIRELSAG